MEIRIKKLSDTAVIPELGSADAAGYDLYADLGEMIRKHMIAPHCTAKIGTGVAVAIPKGYFGAIFARSGIAAKRGLRPANCVGVVDSDYRGELIVALHNDSDSMQSISNGERIAQLVIIPCLNPTILVVEDLDETQRGKGGFGSTGEQHIVHKDMNDSMNTYGQLSLFS